MQFRLLAPEELSRAHWPSCWVEPASVISGLVAALESFEFPETLVVSGAAHDASNKLANTSFDFIRPPFKDNVGTGAVALEGNFDNAMDVAEITFKSGHDDVQAVAAMGISHDAGAVDRCNIVRDTVGP